MVSSALVLATSFAASAQPAATPSAGSDRALATELFKQGRALMTEKKYDEACPKLEESQRLDPGGGTLLNLALCHEAAGRTATAWSELAEAAAIAQRDGRKDREKLALKHAAALEPKLMRLVIEVPTEAALPELSILRNGAGVAKAAWGAAMPLDPGEYEVEASAPGFVTWRTKVQMTTEGEHKTVKVPVLEALPPEPPPPVPVVPLQLPPVAPVELIRPVPPREAPPPPPDPTPFYIAGGVTGGVGLVGVAIGAGFGALALDKQSLSDDECVGGCTDLGSQASHEAGDAADVSTAMFVIGGAAAGASVILFAVGATTKAPSPSVAVSVTVRSVSVDMAW